MYRLFVAIELPPQIKAHLAQLSFGLPGARWTDDDQMHLTLRFIGEVDRFLFDDIRKNLFEVQFDPFDLVLEGVGCFPTRGKPQVLWAGVERSEPLVSLRNRVERVVAQTGVEPEGRKFSPHITLARLKDTPQSHLNEYLAEHISFQTEPFEVEEFHLYSSVLTSKGAIHEKEETYSFYEELT